MNYCTNSDHEIVNAEANGKPYKYCRDCKLEYDDSPSPVLTEEDITEAPKTILDFGIVLDNDAQVSLKSWWNGTEQKSISRLKDIQSEIIKVQSDILKHTSLPWESKIIVSPKVYEAIYPGFLPKPIEECPETYHIDLNKKEFIEKASQAYTRSGQDHKTLDMDLILAIRREMIS